jgi:HEAT repeat protein
MAALKPNLFRLNRMKTKRLLLPFLAAFFVLAASGVRADEEQDLIAILQSAAGAPAKCSACVKLRVVGTVKAVPALAALLGQERTAQAARYALEGMPFPEAVTALRQALGATSGLIKAGIIDSLGWRHDAAAVPLLTPLLSDADATIASAAATALGRIGGGDAAGALMGLVRGNQAPSQAPPAVRVAAMESLLAYAQEILGGGDTNRAMALFSVLSPPPPPGPENVRIAAWRGRVMADASGRGERVMAALSGQDRLLHAAALKVVRELKDAAVIEACVRQWASLPADSQLAVLDAQVQLDPHSLSVVRTATQSPHLSVRVAAWQAMAELGDASAIPALAKAAAAGETAERDAARDTLARLRGPGVREALLEQLAGAEPPEKAELLRALGERGDTEAASVLLQNADLGPEPARLAALESLRKLALAATFTPLLGLAAKSKSEAECEPVLKALYAVTQASHDKDRLTRSLLETMGGIAGAERRRVLPLLSELGTVAALEAAQAAARDADPELAKEAVRVLSQWPNAAPAAGLLELARASAEPGLGVLALRGCIQVAGQEPDAAKRLEMLRQAMAAARRPEEKKQALGGIGQVPTPEALRTAVAELAEPGLGNEAGLAALRIAEKLAGANPKLAAEAAEQVLAQCKTPDVVKRAWAMRGKPAGAGPFIQDWQVCGPYRQAGIIGAVALFDIAFGPEKAGEAAQWKAMPRGDVANLSGAFPDEMNCVAYLKTRIVAPEECDAALLLGSDDGVKAWLNGAVVHSNNVDRGLVADQDMAPIRLKKGANELMLKITQGGGGWAACARVIGTDGKPVRGLRAEP